MTTCGRAFALAPLLALLLAAPASASVIYSYTGRPYDALGDSPAIPGTYTQAMSVSVLIELDAPPPPGASTNVTASVLGYAVSDGRVTLTESDSTLIFANFVVSKVGAIYGWHVEVATEPAGIGSIYSRIATLYGGPHFDFAQLRKCLDASCEDYEEDGAAAGVTNAQGAWTQVPEPSSAVLVLLAAAAAVRSRRRATIR